MTLNISTAGGISQRTAVWAERQMLRHQQPVIVLDKFGMAKPMPKNKGVVIKFRRPVPFAAATTPLVEGVTPTSTQFRYEDVTTTLRQYGFLSTMTDVIEDTHEDPVLNDMVVQAGENAGRTIEQITYGVLRAGTNVFYANGTARTDVNTPISLAKLRAVARALKAQKAMKITQILGPGINAVGTRPIEASWPAVVHTDLEADVRNLPGFTPTAEYGSRTLIHDHEFGSVEEFRFISSPDLDPFADGGGTAGSMVTTTGTSADVYPILIFGKEAYGLTPLRGMGAIEPKIRRPGTMDSGDKLGQIGWVGWKTYFTSVILNQAWMARLEVAATAL